nr:unnamed protein product [Callosobruchus analis]
MPIVVSGQQTVIATSLFPTCLADVSATTAVSEKALVSTKVPKQVSTTPITVDEDIKSNEISESNGKPIHAAQADEKQKPTKEQPPTVDRVEAFWRDVYEQPKPLQADTPALAQFESVCRRTSNTNVLRHPINTEEIVGALRGAKNFAAPGPDGINTYWLKRFPSCHRHLARVFNSWLNQEQPIPVWFVEGRTVLLPKTGDLSDPKNYRPITCLNACYKLFTRILYTRILEAVNPVFLDVYEQRGSKKGVAGCKENLLIDRCVTQDSVQYKRNLSMAWIDYRKAFDTTSHELIVRLLECLSVDNQIVGCIKHLMPLWKTRFTITSGETRVRIELVSFKRGVFQGDSLSPLLFCISLLPLSIALKNTKGYSCGTPNHRRHKVTHLFYMDDLKLYASGQRDLQHALRVVQEYSHAIGMEFGTDKCAMVHLKKGRCEDSEEEEQLVDGSILRQLHAGDTYIYLGVAQRHVQEANTVKECLRRKYLHRLRQIWSSELSGKNKVAATNMLAVPLLLYTFGALHWTVDELRQIDTKTRKRMNMERSLHPKSSVPRIYLPRHLGGRGLLSLERLHNRVVLATAFNVTRSNDPLIRFVREHENAGKGAFLFKAAKRAAEDLSLTLDFTRRCQQSITELAPAQLKTHIKAAEVEFLLKLHKDKPMHGIFYKHLEEHGLSEQLTFSFLRSSGLKSETEGFIMACQDGVVNTLVYRGRVMGMNVPDTRCRACRQAPETLMHLLSACKTYAGTAYVHRHNAALRVLYYHLRHSYGIDETPVLPYTPGDIESVVENERCRIYWNYSFPTLELVQANKPDIVLLDHQQKTMFVIEFSAPAEVNIVSKEEEKRTKYQELLGQLRRLWPDYTVSLLVMVIGSLGGMRNTLLSALRAIPVCRAAAHILAARMQKAVILGSGESRVRTELVSFKRGVFQGDSLSPLLFCISLLPLFIALKNTKGYSCGTPSHRRHKVTHLFYMDDLKLYASGQRDLQHALRVVQEYSHAIGMEFGTDKCAMVHLKKGRCEDSEEEEQLVDGSILRQLHAGDTYIYLGVAQRHVQEANTVKECLRRKYLHRLRQIWSSDLSGKNKVAATNMLVVPLLLYTFGALHWTVDELRQIDTKTRKRMNMERSLHPKSSVPRIYLPRHLGGRGLLSLERLHNRVVSATACNVTRSNDPLIRFVREHENAGKGAFLFKAAKRAAEDLSLTLDFTRRCQQSITELAPAQLKTHIKAAEVEFLLKLHKDKPMHGIFYKHLEEHGLSEQLTFSFLRSSGLKSETEGFIMACQDGVVNTLVYRGRVMGMNVPDTRCRACRQAPETLMHLLSACKTYAGTAYVHRHNAALRVLYYHLRHSYGIDETPVLPYAPGDIESVVENERCRIYWNYSFPTLELVQANKPDIVLLDHQQKTMFVIEFSAPAEVNIVSKEEEKRTKYQELLGQLRRLWPDYTVSLLVMVIGSLGGMRNALLSALRAIPVCRAAAHILAARMQKAVILGSLRLLKAHDTRTQ